MKVTCQKCHQKYDDVYCNTKCPHKQFDMHCGVFVNGQQGCAHTVEELNASRIGVLPNPDCSYQQMLNNLSDALRETQRLKSLSNEDLVRECIKINEKNCLVVDEMCSRLFPAWTGRKGGKK